MVEINCNEENIIMDFVFPTTNVGNTGFGEEIQLGITGTESVFQIVREILVGFQWEEDALGRSKQSFRNSHDGMQKNLENKSTEMIMEAMTSGDERCVLHCRSIFITWEFFYSYSHHFVFFLFNS